ncbi:MAG TPA: hypothetical protein VJP58_03670 [Candidatus Nitrosocosmicus sp.]|nr:hypothetical protein [Candidatus Nitrosocosmicus sp.]
MTKFLPLLLLIVLIYFTESNFYVICAERENIVFNENKADLKSSRLDINNTFSLSGFLVSTLNTSLISSTGSSENTQFISSAPNRTNMENSIQDSTSGQRLDDVFRINDPLSTLNSSHVSRESNKGIDQLNQTDNLSNNLVSMLSDIIIQSIEKGNPTIDNDENKSAPGRLLNQNISTIVSGNWKMNVNSSKVDFFDSKFVMITSDAKGFHWHTITNFNGNGETFFGTDDSIFIDGTVDFFTDDKLVSGNSRVVFMINNFELLQIIFLDNKIADHFHNFPLYGIIDSIEIKN